MYEQGRARIIYMFCLNITCSMCHHFNPQVAIKPLW